MLCCCCCCFGFGGSDECSQKIPPKIFQIIFIIINICVIIFLIATLSIISWGKFSKINITFFLFIFFIVLAGLVLGIIVYIFTDNNKIEKITTNTFSLIMKVGLILTIICLILSIIEEIILSVGFSKAQDEYPCDNVNSTTSVSVEVHAGIFIFKQNGNNLMKNSTISTFPKSKKFDKRLLNNKTLLECYMSFLTPAVYGMAYFTFTLIEIMSIIGICFWINNKKNYSFNDENNNVNNNTKKNNKNNQANFPQTVNIQSPQIVIINQANNNNPSYPQQIEENRKKENKIDNNGSNKFINGGQQLNFNNNTASINYPSQQNIMSNNTNKKFQLNKIVFKGQNTYRNQEQPIIQNNNKFNDENIKKNQITSDRKGLQ